ncbi:MAG: hypothetical protein ACP5C3_08715 [Methanomicrobiales archaeon]
MQEYNKILIHILSILSIMSEDFPDPWEPGGIDTSSSSSSTVSDSSTIYIKCPDCREDGLLIERQGQYFCANCMYNYTELKDDPYKLDEVLIENMKLGGFGIICAQALYERVALVSPREASEYIKKLAIDNNIKLPKGGLLSIIPLTLIIVIIIMSIVLIIIIIAAFYGF